jgi:DNA-binding NtrC family response regulator
MTDHARAAIRHFAISVAHLPLDAARDRFTRAHIEAALMMTGNNQSRAAARLGIRRGSLVRLIRQKVHCNG